MKREFLRELGITETEVIDKIMAEYGKDVQAANAKIPTDYEDIKAELARLKSKSKGSDNKPSKDDKSDDVEVTLEGVASSEQFEALKTFLEQAREERAMLARERIKLKAIAEFEKAGISETEYAGLLDMVIMDDEENSLKRTNDLIGLITNRADAAATKAKEEIMGSTPTPSGSGSSSSPTPEKSFARKMAEKLGEKYKTKGE